MTTTTDDIIWAFGPKSRYAHAYPGRKALDAGVPLCGIQCAPNQITEEFDLTDDRVREAACPNCRARLIFAKHMKPVSSLPPADTKPEQT